MSNAPVIPAGTQGEAVRKAFSEHGLDPHKSSDWVQLVKKLTEKRPPGREKEWTDGRRVELVQEIESIRREHPGKSERNLCRIYVKRHYPDMAGEELRKKTETIRRLLFGIRNGWKAELAEEIEKSWEVEGGRKALNKFVKSPESKIKIIEKPDGSLDFQPIGLRAVRKTK